MKASKYRDMTPEQLDAETHDIAQQLFRLRFQKATGQIDNPQKIREIRKDLARLKTVLTEKAK
ncbi:MAG: 50S ribosomal protein L29 [Acidobacteria bacterium]|nr:MAG: 50S ribosomal protein L29 [Acidobacteriota bacterium]